MNVMGGLDKIFNMFNNAGDAVVTPPGSTQKQDETKDPYADGAKIASDVLEHLREVDKLRWAFERLWFRSILYYLGNQWLTWDARSRRWREKKVRKWVPKPVTNRFASTADTLCSAIQSTKVEPSAWPATEDVEDIAAANIADRVIEVINPEIHVEKVREAIAKWVTLNADAFAFAYYDKKDRSLGMTKIESLGCPVCGGIAQPSEWESTGGCPGCNEKVEPIPSGQFEEYPIGRLKVDVCSPLEVYLNIDITDMTKQRKFTVAKSYSLETAKEMFPDMKDHIHPDTHSATRAAQYFMDALAYSTEDSGYNLTGAVQRDRVTLLRHIQLPSEQYPEGLDATCTMDSICLESEPSPFFEETEEGKKYYSPLIKFGYNMVPGRLYSKTPMFDIIPKQDQLNRIESLLELASMKGVNVNWIIPHGASISNLSGEPSQVIRWTPSGTGGAKPEVVTVAPFHAAMLELKKQYEADFEEIAGTFDAMKGNTPSGVSAGYAIQLLTERSYGRFVSVFANWESGWTDLYTVLLKLFRVYATEQRMRKIRGATGGWEIQAFKGSDLSGAVDIRIEGGSARPRSKLAEQALIEAMAKIGVINPANPEQSYEIAKLFGMTNILGANDEDVRYAAGEWQALLDWNPEADPNTGMPIPQPPQPGMAPSPFPAGGPQVEPIFDNHLVHIMEHRKPSRTEQYKLLPPWKQMFWKNHVLDHMMAIPPPPGSGPSNQPGGSPSGGPKSEATSKANETGDKTMDTVREGGSVAFGGSGKNQHQ
jgi:hypothetical protein